MKLKQLTENINEVVLFSSKEATPEQIWAGAEKVAEIILKECKPYLEQKAKEPMLYRGIRHYATYGEALIKNVRDDRNPRDSTSIQNMFFIDLIAHKGCKANRNNSTFTTATYRDAYEFGTVHYVFPIGEFAFTWGFRDMTEQVNQNDIPLYNVYSRKAYEEIRERQAIAQAHIEEFYTASHPDYWSELPPEKKKYLQQMTADMNLSPGAFAIQHYKELSPSEQRTWDWEFCADLLEKLKSEKDSTLAQAMNTRGEIMISCKQYIAVRESFYREYVSTFIERHR